MTWFSRTVSTDSRQQLCKDFGEYPPKPLNTNETTFPFKIVYLNQFSELIYNIKKDYNSFFTKNSLIKNKDLIKTREEIKKSTKTAYSKFKLSFETLSNPIKICTLILFIILSPFLIIYSIIKITGIIYKIILGSISSAGHENLAGFYINGIGLDNEINIKTKNIIKYNIDINYVISHEHLHLLQCKLGHQFISRLTEPFYLVRVLNILEKNDNKILNYLLMQHECEARLHEMVLSFYRQNGFLPTSYNEFIGLLISWTEYTTELKVYFRKSDERADYYPNYNEFLIRDERTSREMSYILNSIKDDAEIIIRFSQEILPVMYSNLLLYYGDELASKKMLDSIPDTTLFYQVYGSDDDSTEVSAGT